MMHNCPICNSNQWSELNICYNCGWFQEKEEFLFLSEKEAQVYAAQLEEKRRVNSSHWEKFQKVNNRLEKLEEEINSLESNNERLKDLLKQYSGTTEKLKRMKSVNANQKAELEIIKRNEKSLEEKLIISQEKHKQLMESHEELKGKLEKAQWFQNTDTSWSQKNNGYWDPVAIRFTVDKYGYQFEWGDVNKKLPDMLITYTKGRPASAREDSDIVFTEELKGNRKHGGPYPINSKVRGGDRIYIKPFVLKISEAKNYTILLPEYDQLRIK